jgi:tetratricopeptide (TPR) repeat protein
MRITDRIADAHRAVNDVFLSGANSMYRSASIILALAQLTAAGLFGTVAFLFPDPQETLTHAAAVTRSASRQIHQAQQRQQELADPERKALVARLVEENRRLYLALREEDFDAQSVAQLRDALGSVADSLDAMASLLDEAPARQLGRGLGEAAEYLEKQVTAAEAAAKRLEETSALLRSDSLRLAELLRQAPLDLEAIAEVHEALGRFSEGTEALEKVLALPQLPAIRNGLQGFHTSLDAGAQQVDTLASYSYPVVYFEGIRPRATQRPFWPSGGKIAGGMHEAAAGVKAADQELATLGAELPKVREALASSRQILDRSRDTLGTVLQYRGLIEPLVKSLPDTAARLAEDLPKLSKQLAATLRETQRLQEVANSLRATQQQLDRSIAAWPETRKTLVKSAEGLRANRDRLDRVLVGHGKRDLGSASLDNLLAQATPAWQEQVEHAAGAEKAELAELGHSLQQAAEAQNVQAVAMTQVVSLLRWTLAVVAGVLAVLGVWQLLAAGRGQAGITTSARPAG